MLGWTFINFFYSLFNSSIASFCNLFIHNVFSMNINDFTIPWKESFYVWEKQRNISYIEIAYIEFK